MIISGGSRGGGMYGGGGYAGGAGGSELGQVGMVPGQAACMVAELVGPMVPLAVVMVAHVESPQERSAPLVGSAVVAEDLVPVLCLTWVMVGESTYKRRHTSMWAPEVILTWFDQGEISLASSPVAVC